MFFCVFEIVLFKLWDRVWGMQAVYSVYGLYVGVSHVRIMCVLWAQMQVRHTCTM